MIETWTLLRSDADVGSARALEVAAVCATLVDPASGATALRLEQAQMARDGTVTVAYLIHDTCEVDGVTVATSKVKDWLLVDGRVSEEPEWNTLAVRDAEAGIKNTIALREWMCLGHQHRLENVADDQRTLYTPGSDSLISGLPVTCETHSLAKAAALGRLGMGLHHITGTPAAPRFILHASSESRLVDAEGVPVTWDAQELIMGEIHDLLPLSHPFILAYRAALCWLDLRQTLDTAVKTLVVTPDVLKKRARYDPFGRHDLIHPDAPDRVWEDMENRWFR